MTEYLNHMNYAVYIPDKEVFRFFINHRRAIMFAMDHPDEKGVKVYEHYVYIRNGKMWTDDLDLSLGYCVGDCCSSGRCAPNHPCLEMQCGQIWCCETYRGTNKYIKNGVEPR